MAFIAGWGYLLEALSYGFSIFNGADKTTAVTAALDACYQSVAEKELNDAMWAKKPRGLVGDEITEAERASALCRAEIEYQLKAVSRYIK